MANALFIGLRPLFEVALIFYFTSLQAIVYVSPYTLLLGDAMIAQTIVQGHPITFRIVETISEVITGASFLHNFLPPWDWKPSFIEEGLSDFPSLQSKFYSLFHNKYYKLFVYVIGYVALNARSTLWKSISINNPNGLNSPPPSDH